MDELTESELEEFTKTTNPDDQTFHWYQPKMRETIINGIIGAEDLIIKCNLCGQEFVVGDDEHIFRTRMIRHREHHNPEGQTASSNIIRGHCKFLLIEGGEYYGYV